MASNKGLILGVGILGISAIALMNMDTSTTSYLPQSGGISGTSPNTNSDDYTDDTDDSTDDYEMNKSSSECSLAWNSDGTRKNDEWVYHGYISWGPKTGRPCDLNGFRIRVYSDKRTYIAGEPIKILMFKKYYETDWENDWHKWKGQKKEYGEHMAFLMEVTSTDGYSLHDWQKTWGSSVDKSDVDISGDLKSANSDGWHTTYGARMLTINTSDSDVGEFYIRFMGELGPYPRSTCGSEKCEGQTGDDCNNVEKTSQKLLTILPRDCKNESSAESTKQAESKNILRAEHFIQSYQQNWV